VRSAALGRTLARIAAIGGLAALAGCAHGDGRTLPGGIVAAPGPPGARVGGVYPGPPGDRTCCWADREIDVRVRKDAAADDFALKIYLPDVPAFRATPQGFTVTLDDRYRFERCCFGPGMHTVLFRVPDELRARTGPIHVHVRARVTFVPSREKLGPDDRRLAFILVSATFRSFFSGHF
jgi:hypothetical protein